MPKKLIIIAEAGIDTAAALAVAFNEPSLETLLVAGAAGIEAPEPTDEHLHALIERLDPPRLPRYGAALPVAGHEGCTQQKLGLGSTKLKACGLHKPHPADKMIVETVRSHPGEIVVLALGPLTPLARAIDRDGELPRLLKSLIIVGGVGGGGGNAGPVSEYHFCCDPLAARQALHAAMPKTVLPLEVSQSLCFAPTELDQLAAGGGSAGRALRSILPLGIHDLAQEQGIEGMYLADAFGVACAVNPVWFKSRPASVDVETRGELTRGMAVIDQRRQRKAPNVDWVYEADLTAIRGWLFGSLQVA